MGGTTSVVCNIEIQENLDSTIIFLKPPNVCRKI